MKVVTIVGARPQFIKAAAVSRVLREAPGITERLVHTGQHHDANMSELFFEQLHIPRPDHHLGISGGPHGEQTGRMLQAVEAVLLDELPDAVLVYGDTNSTLAGALAAAKLHLPVAHVEAGLRSFNRRMPEEVNRVLTDHLAELLFAPTDAAVENLAAEGIAGARVRLVGDVMYDAALFYAPRARALGEAALRAAGVRAGEYALATVHRAENTDDPARLRAIAQGLAAVAGELPVVLPVHPRTRAALARDGLQAPGVRLIDPVGYLEMLALESGARLVVTDSGGVQKEAFFQRVPCVTLREETEWVELVHAGWNRLAPPVSPAAVADAVRAALLTPPPAAPEGLYGGGQAARRIAADLAHAWGETPPAPRATEAAA